MAVSVIHPEEMPAFRKFTSEIAESGSGRTENLHCTTKAGGSVPVEVSASYVANIFGRDCLVAIVRDISDRLRVMKEIEDLSRFPSENPFPVLRLASDGRILYANPAASSLVDSLADRVAEHVPADWIAVVDRALKTRAVQELEVSCGDRIYRYYFWPIASEDYVNTYGQDITERQQAIQVLEQSEKRLRQLDAMKNSFIAMISHEMNTPLACIGGAVSMLSDPRFGAERESREKILALAQRNHDRLVRLCSDTIDVGQILAGTLVLEVSDADLAHAVRSACGALVFLAASKGVEVATNLPEEPLPVKIDPRRMEQVVRNLVRNALEAARTRVEVVVRKDEAGWLIAVDDDGPGFDLDEMPHLFDVFFMGARKQKSGGGVGFGLPIAKTIVELHGGTVAIENRRDKSDSDRIIGARSTIILPAR